MSINKRFVLPILYMIYDIYIYLQITQRLLVRHQYTVTNEADQVDCSREEKAFSKAL